LPVGSIGSLQLTVDLAPVTSYFRMGKPWNQLRWLVAVALLSVAVASGWSGYGPQRDPPLRVLFIGNSQTSTNNLPAFVAAIARATNGPRVESLMIAPSSVTLENDWFDGRAIKALGDARWDAVVMQQGPSIVPENRTRLCVYSRLFADAARRKGAWPYLLMVWPRAQGGLAAVVDAYASAAKNAQATLLPAGPAWAAARRRDPNLPLYAFDGAHPSPLGTYLAAVVVYAGLTETAPVVPTRLVVSRKRFSIPDDVADVFRDSAAEALRGRYAASSCAA
jgi:hypothetical protein